MTMTHTELQSPTLDSSSSTDDDAASDPEEEEENDDQRIADEDDSVSSDSDTNLSVKPIRSKPMKSPPPPPPVSSSKKRPTLSMTEDNGAGDVEVVAKESSHKKEEEKKKKLKPNGGYGDLKGEDALCPTLAEVVAQLASEVKNGAATRKAFARALEMMTPENGMAWEEKWRRQGIAELEVYRRRKALEGELIAELEDVLRNAGRSVVSS